MLRRSASFARGDDQMGDCFGKNFVAISVALDLKSVPMCGFDFLKLAVPTSHKSTRLRTTIWDLKSAPGARSMSHRAAILEMFSGIPSIEARHDIIHLQIESKHNVRGLKIFLSRFGDVRDSR
jgi:hypothetical protein